MLRKMVSFALVKYLFCSQHLNSILSVSHSPSHYLCALHIVIYIIIRDEMTNDDLVKVEVVSKWLAQFFYSLLLLLFASVSEYIFLFYRISSEWEWQNGKETMLCFNLSENKRRELRKSVSQHPSPTQLLCMHTLTYYTALADIVVTLFFNPFPHFIT